MSYPTGTYETTGFAGGIDPRSARAFGDTAPPPVPSPVLELVEQRIQTAAKQLSEMVHGLHTTAERVFGAEPRGEQAGACANKLERTPQTSLEKLHAALDGMERIVASCGEAAGRLSRL